MNDNELFRLYMQAIGEGYTYQEMNLLRALAVSFSRNSRLHYLPEKKRRRIDPVIKKVMRSGMNHPASLYFANIQSKLREGIK